MIDVVKVKDKVKGNLRAHDILKGIVDSQTLLALSGGTSPDYRRMIVDVGDILPGAECLVDERFIVSKRESTNEQKLEDEGVISYCKKYGIQFHKILSGRNFLETAKDYDEAVTELFEKFPKKVGVMGVGTNLHTAGIFPFSAAAKSPDFVVAETVDDEFPKRITLTLRALGEFQSFIVMMFGKEKRETTKKLLDENENDMQKYPAIFYRKSPAHCYLITDQDV